MSNESSSKDGFPGYTRGYYGKPMNFNCFLRHAILVYEAWKRQNGIGQEDSRLDLHVYTHLACVHRYWLHMNPQSARFFREAIAIAYRHTASHIAIPENISNFLTIVYQEMNLTM